jgi:hypothetical protein
VHSVKEGVLRAQYRWQEAEDPRLFEATYLPACARPECPRNDRRCRFAATAMAYEMGGFPLETD